MGEKLNNYCERIINILNKRRINNEIPIDRKSLSLILGISESSVTRLISKIQNDYGIIVCSRAGYSLPNSIEDLKDTEICLRNSIYSLVDKLNKIESFKKSKDKNYSNRTYIVKEATNVSSR
jgi:hypothetical protein